MDYGLDSTGGAQKACLYCAPDLFLHACWWHYSMLSTTPDQHPATQEVMVSDQSLKRNALHVFIRHKSSTQNVNPSSAKTQG